MLGLGSLLVETAYLHATTFFFVQTNLQAMNMSLLYSVNWFIGKSVRSFYFSF